MKDPETGEFTEEVVTFQVGSMVMFGYFVTNPGNQSLDGVTVVDDNATPDELIDDVTLTVEDLVSGDTNDDVFLNNAGKEWVDVDNLPSSNPSNQGPDYGSPGICVA